MSREQPISGTSVTSFPRVSGDEPVFIKENGYRETFSPRERG